MPDGTSWRRKADSLLRLANDQAGKPEGELAREMLRRIIAKHPELTMGYEPLREFAMSDIGYMLRNGISTGGSWTGHNVKDAVRLMVADYRQRIAAHKGQPTAQLN